MKHTLKHTLMITASVTALAAAGGLALAQGVNEHREQPAAAAPEQKAPQGKVEQQKPNAPQKAETVKPAPTAQAPENKMNQKSDAPQKAEAVKPAPSALRPDKPSGAETVGQSTQPSPRNAQTPSERTAPNAAAQAESKPGVAATLSTEQHAKIRETIRGEKVAAVTGPRFSISVGEAVPRTVRLHRLPNQIIVYAPQYRGYEYILVGDVILIVNPRTMKIVASIPA